MNMNFSGLQSLHFSFNINLKVFFLISNKKNNKILFLLFSLLKSFNLDKI